uniref:Uncharacterized protein n=1 Tax=Plectus sambesii TaxID=2011161 RepID=A0A914W162_9BILA
MSTDLPNASRDKFLDAVKQMAAYKPLPLGQDLIKMSWKFLDSVFDYSRLRHASNQTTFPPEDAEEIKANLPKAITALEEGFPMVEKCLRAEELYAVLTYQSALYFLRDDFKDLMDEKSSTVINAWIDEEWLSEYIESWSYPPPYPECKVPDLTGVPESHTWWTNAHRRGEDNQQMKVKVNSA